MNVNKFVSWLGKTVLKITGWRVEGRVPADIPKSVMIVAPHTSNWDFPIGLMASFALELKGYWVGKHTLFRRPFGGLMRWLGGIPIDRGSSKNFVEQAADYFRERENFILVLAPEGTRKRVDEWKTGFYYIARAAGVPIICAFLDYNRKVAGIGPAIFPTGDIRADMQKIREFYRGIGAKRPENVGDMGVRERKG